MLGSIDGATDGTTVGNGVGVSVGVIVGTSDGAKDGENVGTLDGSKLGCLTVGMAVTCNEGAPDGTAENGSSVSGCVGSTVGTDEPGRVGSSVGTALLRTAGCPLTKIWGSFEGEAVVGGTVGARVVGCSVGTRVGGLEPLQTPAKARTNSFSCSDLEMKLHDLRMFFNVVTHLSEQKDPSAIEASVAPSARAAIVLPH